MKLAHQPARMHHAATLSPPPSTSCAYFPSLRGGCTLCALIAPVSAISVSRFFPSSSAQPLCFLSHPCNLSSFMQLRTLLRNGASLSLLFSMASALFLSPRGCTLCHPQRSDVRTFKRANSFVYKSLPPLCRLFALFSAFVSFVFNRLQPLFPKHPGGGVSALSSRASAVQTLASIASFRSLLRNCCCS